MFNNQRIKDIEQRLDAVISAQERDRMDITQLGDCYATARDKIQAMEKRIAALEETVKAYKEQARDERMRTLEALREIREKISACQDNDKYLDGKIVNCRSDIHRRMDSLDTALNKQIEAILTYFNLTIHLQNELVAKHNVLSNQTPDHGIKLTSTYPQPESSGCAGTKTYTGQS